MGFCGGQTTGSRILIVDDDPDIAKLLTVILKPQGYLVYHAMNGREGLKVAYQWQPDLIILDIMMPELDGWEVCMRLRELTDVPILMLTARSSEADMLRGFTLGADDYMKKPFNRPELELRIRALLRRSFKHNGGLDLTHYSDSMLSINLETEIVEVRGKRLELSSTEYNLLACLVRNAGKTMTHTQLLQEVWGGESGDLSSKLSLYIFYLRKKLNHGDPGHQYIRTQWGRGYSFVGINEF